MLAHLPGRMSQPSRKGVTSNIFILRCSFHKTAKRLSITGLTHLLRLRTKIQSSIVKALIIKIPNNKKKTISPNFCATLTGTNPSLLLTGLSYTTCDFATTETKKKRNTKYQKKKKTSKPTLNCQSSLTILVFQMTINTKNHGLDYFTNTNLPKASN
jgi:hypothetical protein